MKARATALALLLLVAALAAGCTSTPFPWTPAPPTLVVSTPGVLAIATAAPTAGPETPAAIAQPTEPSRTGIVTTTPQAACTNKAQMTRDVTIPDNQVLPPGQSFLKTWRLRNTGTCTWNTSYALAYVRGERLAGAANVPFPRTVAPNDSVDLSVTLTSPAAAGTYRGNWQLRDAAGNLFPITNSADGTFWVQIIVRANVATLTPLPGTPVAQAPTATTAPTAASTAAPTAAATAAPTAAGTAAPTATATAGPTVAPGAAQRITFPAGGTSVSFQVALAAGNPSNYVLAMQALQHIQVATGAGVSLAAADGAGQPLGSVVHPAAGLWDILVPATGDYVVSLTGNGPAIVTIAAPPAMGPNMRPSVSERVQFAAGKTTARVNVNLNPGETHGLVLGARAGQLLTVVLEQPGLTLVALNPDGSVLDPIRTTAGNHFDFTLPVTGDYQLLLQGLGPNAVALEIPAA